MIRLLLQRAPTFSKDGVYDANAAVAVHESNNLWWINITDSIAANANNPHFLWDGWLRSMAESAAGKGANAVIFYTLGGELPFGFNPKDRAPKLNIPVWVLTAEGTRSAEINLEAAPYVEANVAFAPKTRKGHNVAAWIDNGAATTIV